MDGLTPVSDRNWRRSYQSVVVNGCTEMEGKKIKAFYLKLLYNIRFIYFLILRSLEVVGSSSGR